MAKDLDLPEPTHSQVRQSLEISRNTTSSFVRGNEGLIPRKSTDSLQIGPCSVMNGFRKRYTNKKPSKEQLHGIFNATKDVILAPRALACYHICSYYSLLLNSVGPHGQNQPFICIAYLMLVRVTHDRQHIAKECVESNLMSKEPMMSHYFTFRLFVHLQ